MTKKERSLHVNDDVDEDAAEGEPLKKLPLVLMQNADDVNSPAKSSASSKKIPGNKTLSSREPSNLNRDVASRSPSKVEIGSLPAVRYSGRINENFPRENSKLKHQSKVMRMATVSMAQRPRASTGGNFTKPGSYVEPRRADKVIAWDEATNARPPLRIDMDGPTPCSYSPRNKPLKETNSPAWSFGRKSFVEKKGGSRTSWEKTWFQSSNVWQQKTDFHREKVWPSPPSYKQPPSLGPRQMTNIGFPAFSIGVRREIKQYKTEDDPAPNEYEPQRSTALLMPRHPAFSHGHRRGGTLLWPSNEGYTNPGPGAYEPQLGSSKQHYPAFTICGTRRSKAHELGPFATF